MSEHRKKGFFISGLIAALCLAASVSVSADPMPITSGSLVWIRGDSANINLASSGGSLTMSVGGELGIFGPWDMCSSPVCMADSTVPLTAEFSGNDLGGTAIFNGTTYEVGGQSVSDAQADLAWHGSLTLPANFTGGTLTSPFSFSGSFGVPTGPGFTLNNVGLTGNGMATLSFSPWGAFPGAFTLSSARYDFQAGASPTPEPASMFLLATGLSAAFVRRRRK